jgi:hypothetical protein
MDWQGEGEHEQTDNKSQKFRHAPPDRIGFAYLYVADRILVTQNFSEIARNTQMSLSTLELSQIPHHQREHCGAIG